MNILDETVGVMGWKREHSRDNANCTVSLWDEQKLQWVSKEDTGTESNTEKEKGLASDSFKRACFNWGIGRELYTGPFIWVKAEDIHGDIRQARYQCDEIGYDSNGIINRLVISQQGKNVVFTFGKTETKKTATPKKSTTTKKEVSKAINGERRATEEQKNAIREKYSVEQIDKMLSNLNKPLDYLTYSEAQTMIAYKPQSKLDDLPNH